VELYKGRHTHRLENMLLTLIRFKNSSSLVLVIFLELFGTFVSCVNFIHVFVEFCCTCLSVFELETSFTTVSRMMTAWR